MSQLLKNKNFGIFAILIMTTVHCARQMAPSGGPEDKTPPAIISVIPEPNATHVPRDQIVEFEFSEGMNRKSLDRALFITPNPGDRVKIKWKGRRLRIQFLDSLLANRTYVITLGTGLKDAHGNSLSQSYTLAFSTGAEISQGKIRGRVYTRRRSQGILIWAYILEKDPNPNPSKREGDYITQTDARGNFTLSNLSEGWYRIFAIHDRDNNRFYEISTDAIGVPTRDIHLTSDRLSVDQVQFKLSIQDTVGPALVSASAPDAHHVILKFDERLDPATIGHVKNYSIYPKNGTDTLEVKLAYLNPLDSVEVHLVTEKQTGGQPYEVLARNLLDLSQNLIDPNYNHLEFIGSALPDTIRPRLLRTSPEDSAKSVFLDASIDFYFNEAMDSTTFAPNFRLLDSNQVVIKGQLHWPAPSLVKFVPVKPLASLMNFTVVLNLQGIKDIFGNSVADSTFKLLFTTLDQDTLGSISGHVLDPDSSAKGAIYLTARQTRTNGVSYQIRLDQPGPYEFINVLPGNYSIEGFRDRDGNGKYSYGRPIPFEPAERFVVYSDSVKVRARWPNEGNDIIFPK